MSPTRTNVIHNTANRSRELKPRPTHWVVQFAGPTDRPQHLSSRPAIPFTLFAPAYSLAKRATSENHPAAAIEVYEKDGQFYDVNGDHVRVRGVA